MNIVADMNVVGQMLRWIQFSKDETARSPWFGCSPSALPPTTEAVGADRHSPATSTLYKLASAFKPS